MYCRCCTASLFEIYLSMFNYMCFLKIGERKNSFLNYCCVLPIWIKEGSRIIEILKF